MTPSRMSDPLLIYGATGFTGRLMIAGALERGLRPVLAGRDEARLAALAGGLGLEYRTARLGDGPALDAALRDVRVVLHAAGPFSETSRPMVEACLRAGAHYLDITGEISVIEALAARHAEARRRGVMVMPSVGFDVVPSDCLAAHVAARLPGARHLALGITGLRIATRGSAKTLTEHAFHGVQVRRGGALVRVPAGALRRGFDFGDGLRPSLAVLWGDVATAWYTTGIPDVEVYFEANPVVLSLLFATRWFGWLLATAPPFLPAQHFGSRTNRVRERDRIRVAIVGGGCAAMSAAFELTRPEHAGRYQVVVYQVGWRLGGKGASGRGAAGRIEEHGLHLWMGFYENAFRLVRECYAELGRDPRICPIADWRDAFAPAPLVGVAERAPDGRWVPW